MSALPQGEHADIDRAVDAFSRERWRYDRLASYVCGLIGDHCGGGLIHTTEHRAKSTDSFEKKCRKLNDDGSLRYPRPLEQLTDLAGVRVIVFLRDSVDRVCSEIGRLFDVVEEEDVGDRVYKQGKFGYQSKHLLVRLGTDRAPLVENASIQGLLCEVQVRTILQHAWAEMEHDIQYKTEIDVPLDLNKRFSALAGLLEIADREFASIQRDSEALRLAVKEDLITDLTQQSLTETHGRKAGAEGDRQATDARELVSKGRFADAIDIYSTKIEAEPNSYTLFIGRARARFLAGDVRGAVADLDRVDYLRGDTVATGRLRGIIEKGDDPRKAAIELQTPAKFSADRQSASESIRLGDGVRAFEHYSRLEEMGFNRAYSLLGKAMACTLERDVNGARSFLGSLALRAGTPMAVNICALDCILDILYGQDIASHYEQLEQAIKDAPQFDLALSALDDLRTGLNAKAFPEAEQIDAVFARLEEP